jgi:hypothetical protein
MPPEGHVPEWPDKAMFAAILLILAGAVGLAFAVVKAAGLVQVDEDGLPAVFTDDLPGYTLTLCAATMALGILSLWRQAALFAYLGAATAVLSLAVYGLLPFFGLLAVAAMAKSHAEKEETALDTEVMPASEWPDKALAASLFLVATGAIALTQAGLLLAGRFQPILWLGHPQVAGVLGLAVGALCLLAGREVYHVRRPWLGWLAFAGGLATLGFYLVGPVLALVGMLLLGLAHKEDEFTQHLLGQDQGRRRRRRARAAKTAA